MKYQAEDHLRLVTVIAGRYAKITDVEFDDLFQEGCIGLVKACKEYKEGAVPFGAYAGQQITFTILHYLRKGNKGVHIPTNTVDLAMSISKRNLSYESAEVIAKTFNVTENRAQNALDYLFLQIKSIDGVKVKSKHGSKDELLIDTLKAKPKEMDTNLFLHNLRNLMTKTEFSILKLHMKGYTTKEIAASISRDEKYTRNTLSVLRKRFRENYAFLKEDIVMSREVTV